MTEYVITVTGREAERAHTESLPAAEALAKTFAAHWIGKIVTVCRSRGEQHPIRAYVGALKERVEVRHAVAPPRPPKPETRRI